MFADEDHPRPGVLEDGHQRLFDFHPRFRRHIIGDAFPRVQNDERIVHRRQKAMKTRDDVVSDDELSRVKFEGGEEMDILLGCEVREETWAAIYHGRVLRCVLLCSPKVNRAARFIRWRTEHKKSSDDATFSEARRRGTRRLALRRPVGPTATSLVPSPPTRRESVRGDVRYVYSVIEPHAVRYNRGRRRWEFGGTDPDRGEHTPPTRLRRAA